MTSQFIAFDDQAIWGMGETREAALADAGGNAGSCRVQRATQALIGTIQIRGGDVAWRTLPGGLAGLPAEADAAEESARNAVAASLGGDNCSDWRDERREMLERMADALAHGSAAVCLSSNGVLHWAPGMLARDDGRAPTRQTGARLSHRRDCAAEEMRANLGDDTWIRRAAANAAAEIAQRRTTMAALGEALYGAEWVSPLARDLEVALRTMQRWAAGETPIPRGVTNDDLPKLARRLAPGRLASLERTAAVLRTYVT